MLSKILSTATLIVAAWLSMQILHTHKALDSTQASFYGELSKVRAELGSVTTQTRSIGSDIPTRLDAHMDDVLARLDTMSAQQLTLAKAAKNTADPKILKAKNQEIARLKQTAALQKVFNTVLEAGLAGYEKQGDKAAELLLSTKKAVWKASDNYPDKKADLRGLMAPIDILAGRWKKGDYSGDTKKIQAVLLDVLNAQAQS